MATDAVSPWCFPCWRNRVVALCLCLLMLPFAGCRQSAAPTKPRIALVMKSLANEFFSTMAEGARQHQAAHPEAYELIINGIKNETDLGEQATSSNK